MSLRALAIEEDNRPSYTALTVEDQINMDDVTIQLHEAYGELDAAFREHDVNEITLESLEKVFKEELELLASRNVTFEDASKSNSTNVYACKATDIEAAVSLTLEAMEIDPLLALEATNGEKKSLIQKIKEILVKLGGKFKKLITNIIVIVSGWFADKSKSIVNTQALLNDLDTTDKPEGELAKSKLKQISKRFAADIQLDNGVLTEKSVMWMLEGLTDKSTKAVRADVDAIYNAIIDGRELPNLSAVSKNKVKRYGKLFEVKEGEEVILVLRTTSNVIKALVKTEKSFKMLHQKLEINKKIKVEVLSTPAMRTIINTLVEVSTGIKKELFSDEDVYHAAVDAANKMKDEDGYAKAKIIGNISPKVFVFVVREIHKLTLNLFDLVEVNRKLYSK